MRASFAPHILIISIIIIVYFDVVSGFQLKSRTPYAVKDRHNVPRQWSRVGQAPALHIIELQIGLKQGNFDELERHLYEVSDPFHARYGQHLSAAEVNDLVKPTQDTLAEVEDWLYGRGIKKDELQYSPAKDWIKLVLTIESAEQLLDTKYSIFRHDDGSLLARTPQWSLPLHLHEYVETIQPTNSFLRPRAKRSGLRVVPMVETSEQYYTPVTNSKPTVAEACNVSGITTQCLRTLYGTADYRVQSASKSLIGVANYLEETANRSDISIFLQKFRSEAASASQSFKIQTVNGAVDSQSQENSTELDSQLGIEGNLDAETILGITYPTPMIVYNVGGSPPFQTDLVTPTNTNEPYLDWIQFTLNQTALPNVVSQSYGDDEQTVPLSFATAVCKGFAQLGARGATVLFPSGDEGVGASGKCFSNDGKNTSTFLPGFPAGCPYVTAVGGTKNINPEVVAFDAPNEFASGGGFSNYFARPSYQDSVVPAYVSSLNGQYKAFFNSSGRAYPDIAAQSQQFLIVWNGTMVRVDGTSAATPTAASIISLVNDALIAAGKPVLGFMNPWLYSVGSKAFTDITNGSAVGCNTTGFPAAVGWDAVTGFGTPNFPKIQAVVLNNGTTSSSPSLSYALVIAVASILLSIALSI